MKFSDMFQDDHTGQLSMGRVSAALILLYLLGCTGHLMITGKVLTDIPANWMAAMLAFYGINKGSSVITKIKGDTTNVADNSVAVPE